MKKIICVLSLLFVATNLFAQKVESVGLKDSDVQNFGKNFNKIEKALDKIDVDLDDRDFLNSIKDVKKVEDILTKNGISNPNAIQKICIIAYGIAYIETEKQMALLDDQTKTMMESMGSMNQIKEFRSKINDDDYKVIQKNYSYLSKIVDEFTDD